MLEAIEPPSVWMADRTSLPYCFACLVLNPSDVMAPRWKREWLAPEAARCDVHDRALAWVRASSLRRAGHFAQLHGAILQRHRDAKFRKYGFDLHLQDWWTYSQH